MTTIGDVLAVIAALIGLGLTSWALLVSCALLFPKKVSLAMVASETNARTNFALGLLMLAPCFVGVVMLGNPLPLLKLLGAVILLGALSVAAIGAAGLGFLAADQIRRMDPKLGEYAAFVRGSGFLVTASMLPILGWFVFGPCVLLASLGGGLRAVSGRVVDRSPSLVETLI